jgi:hydroxymethylpyrimidine kinase/phosphomethylpyrimidine kinase/thiamine-phosphate diphosphorylase
VKKPIVWTIAGSDSGGGAGIQADMRTFENLGAYGCSVITALTAQNSVSVSHVEYATPTSILAQIHSLEKDLPAQAVKTGMLGNTSIIQTVIKGLTLYKGPLIIDPVMISTSNDYLLEMDAIECLINKLIPKATLITPNLPEASILLNRLVTTPEEMETAAQDLLSLGPKSVLIKGGHCQSSVSQDFWTDGTDSFWMTAERFNHPHNHGAGCTLAAAIAACLGLGFSLPSALVIAKAYVTQGLRYAKHYGKGPGPLQHGQWPYAEIDLPIVTRGAPSSLTPYPAFPSCGPTAIGLYPIVDRASWLERLLPQGVTSIQLRIKDLQGEQLEREIQDAIKIANKYHARLFINDYWQLALRHRAYGVHVGQEDIDDVDMPALANAGIRLGISTHNYWEVAHALAYKPSYIAIGTIFPTTSKPMTQPPQGIKSLARWCRTLNYPLVAIGGINEQNLQSVLTTGVDGVSVISAIRDAENPEATAKKWIMSFQQQVARSIQDSE